MSNETKALLLERYGEKLEHSDEELFTLSFDDDEFLSHHGIKGMKWGIWNAETKRKYASAMHAALKRVGSGVSVAAKKGKKVAGSLSAKAGKAMAAKQEERKEKNEAKRKQAEFDKETKKRYGLSSKQYKRLREATLKTNDPAKVAKGMHLLTDDELREKINRISLEDQVRKSATTKRTDEANAAKAKAEAHSKTVAGRIENIVITKAVNTAISGAAKALTDDGITPYVSALSKKYADKAIAKINEKAQEASKEETSKEKPKETVVFKSASKIDRAEREAIRAEVEHYAKVAKEGSDRVKLQESERKAAISMAKQAKKNLWDLNREITDDARAQTLNTSRQSGEAIRNLENLENDIKKKQ